MYSYLTVKFQNFDVVTKSVPCSPGLTVFFSTPPGSTVQLLFPSRLRSFQPVVSLPLNRGRNPSVFAAITSTAEAIRETEMSATSRFFILGGVDYSHGCED